MHGKKEQILHAERLKPCKGLEDRMINPTPDHGDSESDEEEDNEVLPRGEDIIEFPLMHREMARDENEEIVDQNENNGVNEEIRAQEEDEFLARGQELPVRHREIEENIIQENEENSEEEEEEEEVEEHEPEVRRSTRTRDIKWPARFKEYVMKKL